MSSSPTPRRRVPIRTALFAASGIALAAGLTATMSAWTDQATITADVTSGTFDLTLDDAQTVTLGDVGEILDPGDEVTDSYAMVNSSSASATVDLDVAGFTGATTGAWNLAVSVDGTEVYSGDPTTAVASIDLTADGTLTLDPAGTAQVAVTLTLVDSTTAPQDEAIAPVLTFTAVQVQA
ncbi:MAG TPA: SipW-dependent-type signal peptide-containing protein [Cellulomonas sp.]